MATLFYAALIAACLLTLAAAWTDAKKGIIPNVLTLPALGLGLLLGLLTGGLWGLGQALCGAFFCFIVPWGLFQFSKGSAIGGGDVKVFAALGALLGPSLGLEVQLTSLVLLAFFSMLLLAWRGGLFAMLKRSLWLMLGWALPKRWQPEMSPEHFTAMRMGPAICLATWGSIAFNYLPFLL